MGPVKALLWVAALIFAFTVAGWVGPVALLMVGGMLSGRKCRHRRVHRARRY